MDDTLQELFYNISSGDLDQVIPLLDKFKEEENFDWNVRDLLGNTLLHWACFRGSVQLVDYLLIQGSDPKLTNTTNQQTPLHWACTSGSLLVAKHMIEAGAPISALDYEGHDALYFAIWNKHPVLVHMLLLMNAQVDVRDYKGNTGLHWAALKGYEAIALILLSAGANVSAQNIHGSTPLHLAGYKGHLAVFQTLLQKGADLKAQTNANETPEDISTPKIRHYLKTYERTNTRFRWADSNKFWVAVVVVVYQMLLFLISQYPFWLAIAFAVGVFVTLRNLLPGYPRADKPTSLFPSIVIITWISMLYVWAVRIFPQMSDRPIELLCYMMVNLIAGGMYMLTLFVYTDPGIIRHTPEQDKEAFLDDIELGHEPISVCAQDRIRRPLRSKHVKPLDVCVAKFDHYCPWISNAVGEGNHKSFMVTLFFVCVVLWWFCKIVYFGLPVSQATTYFGAISDILVKETLLCFLLFQALFYATWLTLQFIQQIRGIFTNITINERLNHQRYPHFWLQGVIGQDYFNPFDRGTWIKNLMEFVNPTVNWYKAYYLKSGEDSLVIVVDE